MDNELKQFLENKARWVRQTVLDMAVKAKSGHVSTAFSQCEMLCALYYGRFLNFDPHAPDNPERDRFILSKGQGGIGLYPILADLGFFHKDELDKFIQADGILGVHCENNVPGIEFLMGSLGHGLGVATGIAHAARMDKKDFLTVVMVGDGELYEGSNWEAMFTAGSQRYRNLVVIVDQNGQATIGKLNKNTLASDGPRQGSLRAKFESFDFDVYEVAGHDFESIFEGLAHMRRQRVGEPLCIISHTEKGHGASVMADKRLYHYRVPAGVDLEKTIKELGDVAS